jgi:hypothetical protein
MSVQPVSVINTLLQAMKCLEFWVPHRSNHNGRQLTKYEFSEFNLLWLNNWKLIERRSTNIFFHIQYSTFCPFCVPLHSATRSGHKTRTRTLFSPSYTILDRMQILHYGVYRWVCWLFLWRKLFHGLRNMFGFLNKDFSIIKSGNKKSQVLRYTKTNGRGLFKDRFTKKNTSLHICKFWMDQFWNRMLRNLI